jgi:hypothetical protein
VEPREQKLNYDVGITMEDCIAQSDGEEQEMPEEYFDADEEWATEHVNNEEDYYDVVNMNWEYETPPMQPATPFTGDPWPQHTLSPETSLPFD